MREYTDAGDRWIPTGEYQMICARVPILCVDLLPVLGDTGQCGLIERDTYAGGHGLNLVGGAVLLDEPLDEAVARHLRVTLGPAARLRPGSLTFVGVHQYFKVARQGLPHDPRKNAVSATYVGIVDGECVPMGEAHALRVFDPDRPPAPGEFGFGQGSVVYDALASLATRSGAAAPVTPAAGAPAPAPTSG